MKKILVLFVLALAAAVGAKWYFGHMLDREAVEVSALMREATGMLSRQIGFLKDPRGETHAEVIAYAAQSVTRTGLLVEKLIARQDVRDRQLVDHGVEYLKVCQEASRFMRKMVLDKAEMAVTLKEMERAIGTMQDFVADPNSQAKKFHSDVAGYGAAPLIRRSKEAQESLDSSAASFGAALSKLVAMREAKPNRLQLDAYVTNDMVTGMSFSIR